MASTDSANLNKAIVLVILMITMTQVGYLDSMNSLTNGEETLDETDDVMETGGSGSTGTSVVYGNNSWWTPHGALGGISRNSQFIALSSDTVLYQAASSFTSDHGCPHAYNSSNLTAWQPTLSGISTSNCNTKVGDYIAMIDGLTYFTMNPNNPTIGWGNWFNIYAYNPSNDTIYPVLDLNKRLIEAVGIGRTIYANTKCQSHCPSFLPSGTEFIAYNVDNQSTWVVEDGLPTNPYHLDLQHLHVVENKIIPLDSTRYIFNSLNETWYTSPSSPSKGTGGSYEYEGLVSNGQMLFWEKDSMHGHEPWIYDSSNDSFWMVDDFYNGSSDGALVAQNAFSAMKSKPAIRDGNNMYFVARSDATIFDLWGYSTVNSSYWHIHNISQTFVLSTSSTSSTIDVQVKIGLLASGDLVVSGLRTGISSSGEWDTAYYSFVNDTMWRVTTYQTQSSLGHGTSSSYSMLLGIRGNTVWISNMDKFISYNTENGSAYAETVAWGKNNIQSDGVMFGNQFIVNFYCGNMASSCNGVGAIDFVIWSPEAVSVNPAWNFTAGQRIDGPITGGTGSMYNSGIGIQDLTASVEGADLYVDVPMTNITFGTSSASSSSLAQGYRHTCGILDNGSVKCWGVRTNGRLGNFATQNIGDNAGEMGDALAVTNLGTGRTATSISAVGHQDSAHTCAVLDDGTVKCWGVNGQGQLGIGNTTTMGDTAGRMGDNLSTVDLGTGRTAVDVSVGNQFSCALLDNGDVKCWGVNGQGQLGIGTTTAMGDNANEMGDNLAAVDLGTGRTAVAIATGYWHACAILDNGGMKCWGGNSYGQLGIGSTTAVGDAAGEMGDNLSYTSLGTGLTPVYIDAGNAHTCAIFDNGSVKCWGFNEKGNLGLGTTSNQGDDLNEMGDNLSFVELGTGRTAVDLTAMTQAVCAVLDNGSVKCWGHNNHGQLGIGNTANIGDGPNEMGDNLAPADLGTGVKALAVESGFSHVCAIIDNGSLKCWGSNGDASNGGWLGLGDILQRGKVPTTMGDNLPFVDLGTGASIPISQFTSCTSSPNLPPGLSMNNCTISGTPTTASTNQTYTISSVLNGVTYQASIYLSASYLELTPSVEGAELLVGQAMTNINFQYNAGAASGSGSGSGTTTNGNGTTWQVADIRSGSSDSFAGEEMSVLVGDTIYFDAMSTGNSGLELWAHDTSNASTWKVVDSYSGSSSGDPGRFMEIVVGDTLYFSARDGSSGHELWAHDTSNTSTWQVADIRSGSSSSNPGYNMDVILVGDTIYFDAVGTGNSGYELWAHDTSNASTWQVADIRSGSSSSDPGVGGMETLVGDTIYFVADDGSSGYELWAHDTSNASTWQAADIRSGSGSSIPGVNMAILVGDTIYFDADDGSTGIELWAHDTSNASTWQVADIRSVSSSSPGTTMAILVGDTLYFSARDGSSGHELWAHDTSNTSTWQVAEIRSGSPSSNPGNSMEILVGDTIYFDADDGSTGIELWAHDTSNASTWQVADIRSDLNSGQSGANPGRNMVILVGDTIYFDALLTSTDRELWAHQPGGGSSSGSGSGSNSGTYNGNGTAWMVKNIASGGVSSFPARLVAVGNTLFFYASDGQNGFELWKSNGTSSGTVMVKNINSGSGSQASSNPNYLIEMGNTLYFSAMDTTNNGHQLWKSDGTASGTVMVTAINSGGTANPGLHTDGFVIMNNNLYFSAEDGTNGVELWKSDGTASGTVMVKDINSGSGESFSYTPPISPVVFNNELYFQAKDGTSGFELWKSDGTASGTVMVKDINSGSGDSKPEHLTVVGNTLFFMANDGINGFELWKSDGTASGTVMIKDINSGSAHGAPNYLAAVGNTLFFNANDGINGAELWKSDGTALGTVMVKNINSGTSSSPNYLTAVGNTLYFNADDGTHGDELWKSDGTASGTVMVKDIGNAGSNGDPGWLTAVGNTLYFQADTGTYGGELWKSDGTASGTVMVQDIYSGTSSSGAHEFVLVDNTIYFSARDGTHGDELWALDPANITGLGSGSGSGSGGGMTNVTGATSCVASPSLPNGLNIDSSTCTISGTPTVATSNTTYTVTAVINSVTYQGSVWLAVLDTNSGATDVDTPIVLLNNSDVDEIAPFYPLTGATYGLSPDLPTSMQFDSSNGSIWGTPDMLMTNTTYTMWANLTDGTTTSWTFFLEVLEDLDGDGMPDLLPGDYNATNDPIRTPGLEEDLDDDGDGYNDTAETDTGLYLDGNNTGTDPRDPDTDDDGICDGPGTVAGVCTAGPDLTPFGPPATVVAVNNTMIPSVPPYYAGSGLTYGYSPDLPNGLTIDPNNGYLMGIPTETTGKITYTVYANDTNGNTYSWDFTIEVLEDSDGDGSPDTLPSDYDGDDDSIRPPPGLTEDLDDDNDGASDLDEIANGTEPLNPDSDGDGLCDGINAVPGVCFAGPDPYPNDPAMPIDTDGDGLPDDDSGWTGPPYADDDDDNDGYPDVSEDACGSDSLDADSIPADMDGDTICDGDDDDMDGDGIENVNETGDTTVPPGSSPINPDTDGDGICDGPESPMTSNCTAGPDMFPLDPSAWEDTDGDGYPNELFPPSTSVPPLEEDTDDDNDGWSDIDEVNCGSDPVDGTDMPVDENGDGICDVLDLDWDDDGIPNVNETDTGVYVNSSDTGTDPWNPDTDGDGFCDGPFAVMNGSEMICSAGPDPFPHDPTLPMDTDGDGLPDELPEDYIGNLVADDDDDNDGYTDAAEDTCGSDSLDNLSMPTDLDGDTICDGDDLDMDGDGILNDAEDATDSITSSSNADTDGDGVCDGPSAPAMPAGICTAGPDAFPDDPAAWLDTDGDGDPDEIVDGVTTDLVLDTDDDNDGWEDVDEAACGTNTKDNMSTPFDGDDDGICDVLDTQTLGYAIYGNESDVFEAYVNQTDFVLIPNLTGMEPGTWTIDPALPAGLSFSGTARSGETGIISGIPTEASPMQNYTITADNGRVNISFTLGLGVLNDFDGDRIPDEESLTGLETDPDDDNDGHLDEIELKCGSDPLNQTSVPDVDEEGNCIEGRYAEDDSDDGTGVLLWCLPLIILLLVLLLLIPLLIGDKVALMGPEPENTTSTPAFMSGNGTKSDPFVLRPIKKLKAGSSAESKEAISITNMSPEILVDLLDLAESNNDKRFMMYEIDGASEESGYKLEADEEGRLRLRFVFDDSANPTYPGAEYEGLLKLGKASVYLSWTVEVKEDKRKMNQIRKEQEAAEKAEKEAKEAQEKAKAEAEAKEAEEKAKAEAEAKAAEEKAAKEAEKKAKAEEKAAAAALAKKEKEEAAAKKKEEAAAKKAKAAEEKAAKEAEEAEAKAKAEAEAKAAEEKAAKEAEKKAKAEEKAAAAVAAAAAKKAKEEAEAKKKAEAEAKAAEEKAAKEAQKKAKAEEKAAAAAAKKAKEEAEAKKKAEAEAKAAKEAEEKAKAKAEAEAKAKAEAEAKAKAEKKPPATTKEAKKEEELQRVKERAKTIDFKVIGEATSTELKSEVKKGAKTLEVGNASEFAENGSAAITDSKGSTLIAWTGKDGNVLTGVSGVTRVFGAASIVMVKDDLQVIKGIGPFIEEKLNALGITTYRQLANMNAKLEKQVNEAIEFFPGRVKRDQWVAQAKILLGMDAKLDEKALKQAEELERVAQKAEGIDFDVLGVATVSEADDLQKIKGIGPFIAEKLFALGIYTFKQVGNMTPEIEEEVNVAIEFFPGRVKRDEWAKQAKELAKD